MVQVIALRTRNLTPPGHPGFAAYRPMGALGLAPVGGAIVSKGTGIAAGAATTAAVESVGAGTWIAAGSVAGPIGMAVGAILGLVVGGLFTKHYLNVAQANAGEDQAVQAFNQYRTIAGQIPGRQIGMDGMHAVWLGAVYSGLFPLNNQRKCFHDGCLKYPGNPDWIYGVLYNGANNPYTFAWAMQQLQSNRGAASASAMQPMLMRSTFPRTALKSLAGLGQVGAAGVPEAVTMVDSFFIPSNTHDSPAWAVPQTALEHQIIYDAADAYLAANAGFSTTPYVGASSSYSLAPAQLLSAASSTVLPALIPTSASTVGSPYFSPGVQPVTTSPTYCISHDLAQGVEARYDQTMMPIVRSCPPLAPIATPLFQPSNPALVSQAGTGTSVMAATNANLDASLAAQGFTRVAMSTQGFPLYSQAGMVYAYENGQLYPFSSVAQLAATGNAGSGLAIPATGIDPNTLAQIRAAVAAGVPPQQAALGAAQTLAAQGVPITPQVQSQLTAASLGGSLSGVSMPMILLFVGGIAAFYLLSGRKKNGAVAAVSQS